MSTLLYRLGRGSARHRKLVVAGWLVAVLALAFAGKAAGGQFHDTFAMPGVDSQRATDLLKRTFPAQAGSGAQVVFHARTGTLTDPANAAGITGAVDTIRHLPHVVAVTDPLTTRAVSPDGTIGLATVSYDQNSISLPKDTFTRLEAATAPAARAGLQV